MVVCYQWATNTPKLSRLGHHDIGRATQREEHFDFFSGYSKMIRSTPLQELKPCSLTHFKPVSWHFCAGIVHHSKTDCSLQMSQDAFTTVTLLPNSRNPSIIALSICGLRTDLHKGSYVSTGCLLLKKKKKDKSDQKHLSTLQGKPILTLD